MYNVWSVYRRNNLRDSYNVVDGIKYGQQFTAEDLGFQTDEYGLLMVDGE